MKNSSRDVCRISAEDAAEALPVESEDVDDPWPCCGPIRPSLTSAEDLAPCFFAESELDVVGARFFLDDNLATETASPS